LRVLLLLDAGCCHAKVAVCVFVYVYVYVCVYVCSYDGGGLFDLAPCRDGFCSTQVSMGDSQRDDTVERLATVLDVVTDEEI
jgi:hypothetical protein